MISLYREDNFTLIRDGVTLNNESVRQSKILFDRYTALGYSPREISQIICSAVQENELICLLNKQMAIHKAKNNNGTKA